MTLTHIISHNDQLMGVGIAFTAYSNLQDGDFTVKMVEVRNSNGVNTDITDLLEKAGVLDKIVDSIDWLQEYAEKKSAEYEYQAEIRREAV